MGNLFKFFSKKDDEQPKDMEYRESDNPLDREIDALYSMLSDVIGPDKLVIKAGKMDALKFMRSPRHGERVLALQRIIMENPTIEHIPTDSEIPKLISVLSEHVADMMARRTLEDKIEKKISEKLSALLRKPEVKEKAKEPVKESILEQLRNNKARADAINEARKKEQALQPHKKKPNRDMEI